MTLNKFKRMTFDKGSCCVFGQRGSGKDTLMGNVAVRNKHHISNVNYGKGYIPLDFDKLNVNNKCDNFVSGKINPYEYPYPLDVDIFISDIGVYFPSQYYDYLNKKYPTMPVFLALSRQLGKGTNVHLNTQSLARPWDKFREQSDTYILCECVKYILCGKVCIQKVTVYDNYETATKCAKPFWYPPMRLLATKDERQTYRNNRLMAYARYYETHGNVKRYTLIYRNKAKYDTYLFKTMLEGLNNEKTH